MSDPDDRPPQQDASTQPPPPPTAPMGYAPPGTSPPRSPFRSFVRFTSGVFTGFIVVFIPTFFAGGSAIEGSLPRWAWPAVIAAAFACAAYAWSRRRRNPPLSAGLWIGTGLGLLLAGACFMQM